MTEHPRRAEILTALGFVSGAYPTVALFEAMVAVWADLLDDLPAGSIVAAVRGLLATRTGAEGRWPPTPGDVRDAATGGLQGVDGEPAILAWGRVVAEMGRVGATPWVGGDGWPLSDAGVGDRGITPRPLGQPTLDAATWEALRVIAGSWRELHEADAIGRAAHRARFVEAYDALRERRRRARLLSPAMTAALNAVAPLRLLARPTDPTGVRS